MHYEIFGEKETDKKGGHTHWRRGERSVKQTYDVDIEVKKESFEARGKENISPTAQPPLTPFFLIL
jgi:hypothetical protein